MYAKYTYVGKFGAEFGWQTHLHNSSARRRHNQATSQSVRD